jgi:hypothetical protein
LQKILSVFITYSKHRISVIEHQAVVIARSEATKQSQPLGISAQARIHYQAVQTILEAGDIDLKITGRLTDGTPFEAADTIKVIERG